MNEITFTEKVKSHFSFLETEYNFKIAFEKDSDVHPEIEGVVEYASDNTVVVVDSELGSASVWFYRIQDGKKHELDPIIVNEYLSTNESEKQLLLSTNPKDAATASALFNQKFLLNLPSWKTSSDDTVLHKLDVRLVKYADWLNSHANYCLKGDFSTWPELYEYKIYRARADHLRSGKNELGFVRIKEQDGNWKLVQQSIFKDKLEHVQKLKKEFFK